MQELPKIEAIDRALALLSALADAGPTGTSLGDLAGRTRVNKSTAYRALSTMRARGFATQSVDGTTYRLGPAAMGLGAAFVTPENLAVSLHPMLVAVSRASEELVHLGVWVDDHVLYIDKVEPARAIRVWSSVGQWVPVATSALGRAMLAARNVDEEQQKLYLQHLGGERTVSPQRLQAAVRQARRRGYSTELEENEPGVACLGTAIMQGDHVVAAISITAPAERMTSRRQVELADLIRTVVPPLLPDSLSLMPIGG
jgi:DNA-binding IclR family transcriptional regulator